MSDASLIAILINQHPSAVKSGTLRIWGDWFGRPYDNVHSAVAAVASGTELQIRFDQGEVLLVQNPAGSVVDASSFHILSAQRVRWEWFYYGRPQIPANRYFREYVHNGIELHCTSNIGWYQHTFNTDLSAPAVELI